MEFYGTPLPYQEEDLVFMHRRMMHPGRSILTHKTGLGKTFIALAGMVHRGDARVLVVGTPKALAVWLTEVPRWTGITPTLITKKTKNREAVWAEACHAQSGIYLINYEMVLRLVGKIPGRQKVIRGSMIPWDFLVLDEAHKKIRGHRTQTFQALQCFPCRHINILSATLASRGPQDLWASLNLIDPKFFSSYWAFVNTHCHVFPGEFGQEIGGVKDAPSLKKLLQKFAIARGNEVRTQMPPIRQVIELEMDDAQKTAYFTLLDEMLLELDSGGAIVVPGVLARNNKLRQLALCPRMLDESLPLGAGIDYILEEIEEDPHTVIFAPQKAILEVLRSELTNAGYNCYVLQGGMKPEDVNKTIAQWKSTRGVCLCTIASAESFALDTVNVAYFLGAEYDPTLNIQAEGRLQRIDSAERPLGITIRYIIIKDTVEENVKDIINGKVANVSKFFDTYLSAQKTLRLKKLGQPLNSS